MKLPLLAQALSHRLSLPLPGSEAQFKMANAERRLNLSKFKVPDNPRKSAVMILLFARNGIVKFPLILRPVYDGVHSGQISLPGGSYEEHDNNLFITALRETEEELGIKKTDVSIIGQLTELYIPPSNYLVTPIVGMLSDSPQFIPDKKEVSKLLEVDIENILDDKYIGEKNIKLSNGLPALTPFFNIHNHTVWGATAMILSELKSLMFEIEY